jgi:hypothetical protein
VGQITDADLIGGTTVVDVDHANRVVVFTPFEPRHSGIDDPVGATEAIRAAIDPFGYHAVFTGLAPYIDTRVAHGEVFEGTALLAESHRKKYEMRIRPLASKARLTAATVAHEVVHFAQYFREMRVLAAYARTRAELLKISRNENDARIDAAFADPIPPNAPSYSLGALLLGQLRLGIMDEFGRAWKEEDDIRQRRYRESVDNPQVSEAERRACIPNGIGRSSPSGTTNSCTNRFPGRTGRGGGETGSSPPSDRWAGGGRH